MTITYAEIIRFFKKEFRIIASQKKIEFYVTKLFKEFIENYSFAEDR